MSHNKSYKEYYQSSEEYKDKLICKEDERFFPFIKLVEKWIPSGSSILELGCGVGQATRLLEKAGFEVFASDISPLFLEKLNETGKGNYFPADISRLPLRNQCLDAVVSNEVIEHLTDIPSALLEMKRVIKNRGWLIICGPGLSSPLWPILDFKDLLRGVGRPPHYRNRTEAINFFFKNIFRSLRISISNEPIFEKREPDYSYPGGDMDATYWSSGSELVKYLKKNGFTIHNIAHQGKKFSRSWWVAKIIPGLSIAIAIVAVKNSY